MPYIPITRRGKINLITSELSEEVRSDGELNYAITSLLLKHLANIDGIYSYSTFERIMGLLECVKLELYRRLIAPFEDGKKGENSDVF